MASRFTDIIEETNEFMLEKQRETHFADVFKNKKGLPMSSMLNVVLVRFSDKNSNR
jgi:hypothetical protein